MIVHHVSANGSGVRVEGTSTSDVLMLSEHWIGMLPRVWEGKVQNYGLPSKAIHEVVHVSSWLSSIAARVPVNFRGTVVLNIECWAQWQRAKEPPELVTRWLNVTADVLAFVRPLLGTLDPHDTVRRRVSITGWGEPVAGSNLLTPAFYVAPDTSYQKAEREFTSAAMFYATRDWRIMPYVSPFESRVRKGATRCAPLPMEFASLCGRAVRAIADNGDCRAAILWEDAISEEEKKHAKEWGEAFCKVVQGEEVRDEQQTP